MQPSTKPLLLESKKAKTKRVATATKWLRSNPPDETGHWDCWLQISSLCPRRLSRQLLQLEHVYPKSKYPELALIP